eukprot:1426110-Karenia_brevis.AAC.1
MVDNEDMTIVLPDELSDEDIEVVEILTNPDENAVEDIVEVLTNPDENAEEDIVTVSDVADIEDAGGIEDEHQIDNVLWPKFGSNFLAGVGSGKDKTLLEMFCPPRLVPFFEAHGGVGLSKDLKTGWNGLHWEDRSVLLRWLRVEKPSIVFGCPPC